MRRDVASARSLGRSGCLISIASLLTVALASTSALAAGPVAAPEGASQRSVLLPVTTAVPSPGPIAASEKPCPKDEAAGWDCVTLTLPLDHFADSGKTIDVTFALLRHSGPGPAKGTWVTITGGPGTAGIWSAVDYTASFAPAIHRNDDIVFMDQRGSGMSGGFTCPNAALAWYTTQMEVLR